MAVVRVKKDVRCVVFWQGTQVVLTPDVAFDDSDEFVRANPSYFAKDTDLDEPVVRITAVAVGPDAPVEDATARPGEKRATRRPR